MTGGDVGICLVVWIVGSFVAGAIDAWLQQRKWDKKNKKGGEFSGLHYQTAQQQQPPYFYPLLFQLERKPLLIESEG